MAATESTGAGDNNLGSRCSVIASPPGTIFDVYESEPSSREPAVVDVPAGGAHTASMASIQSIGLGKSAIGLGKSTTATLLKDESSPCSPSSLSSNARCKRPESESSSQPPSSSHVPLPGRVADESNDASEADHVIHSAKFWFMRGGGDNSELLSFYRPYGIHVPDTFGGECKAGETYSECALRELGACLHIHPSWEPVIRSAIHQPTGPTVVKLQTRTHVHHVALWLVHIGTHLPLSIPQLRAQGIQDTRDGSEWHDTSAWRAVQQVLDELRSFEFLEPIVQWLISVVTLKSMAQDLQASLRNESQRQVFWQEAEERRRHQLLGTAAQRTAAGDEAAVQLVEENGLHGTDVLEQLEAEQALAFAANDEASQPSAEGDSAALRLVAQVTRRALYLGDAPQFEQHEVCDDAKSVGCEDEPSPTPEIHTHSMPHSVASDVEPAICSLATGIHRARLSTVSAAAAQSGVRAVVGEVLHAALDSSSDFDASRVVGVLLDGAPIAELEEMAFTMPALQAAQKLDLWAASARAVQADAVLADSSQETCLNELLQHEADVSAGVEHSEPCSLVFGARTLSYSREQLKWYRRFQWRYRARQQGWMSLSQTREYWHFANEHRWAEFYDLVQRCKWPHRPQPPAVQLRLRISSRHGVVGSSIPIAVFRPRIWFRNIVVHDCLDGARERAGEMAAAQEFAALEAQFVAGLEYYCARYHVARAHSPELSASFVVQACSNPGATAEALRRVGLSVACIDVDEQLHSTSQWFDAVTATGGPAVTFTCGNAVMPAVIEKAIATLSGSCKLIGIVFTPPCQPDMTLSQLNKKDNDAVDPKRILLSAVGVCENMWRLYGIHFFIESSRGAATTLKRAGYGDQLQILREGHAGIPVADGAHAILSPRGAPLLLDPAIEKAYCDMRGPPGKRRICQGKSRVIAMLAPDGERTSCKCNGNVIPFTGSSTLSPREKCRWIGLHGSQATSHQAVNNALPCLLGELLGYQQEMYAVRDLHGIPVTSAVEAREDPAQNRWQVALICGFARVADAPTLPQGALQIVDAVLVVAPVAMPGHLVTHCGELITVEISYAVSDESAPRGTLKQAVVVALRASFPALAVRTVDISFVAHLLDAKCKSHVVYLLQHVDDHLVQRLHYRTRKGDDGLASTSFQSLCDSIATDTPSQRSWAPRVTPHVARGAIAAVQQLHPSCFRVADGNEAARVQMAAEWQRSVRRVLFEMDVPATDFATWEAALLSMARAHRAQAWKSVQEVQLSSRRSSRNAAARNAAANAARPATEPVVRIVPRPPTRAEAFAYLRDVGIIRSKRESRRRAAPVADGGAADVAATRAGDEFGERRAQYLKRRAELQLPNEDDAQPSRAQLIQLGNREYVALAFTLDGKMLVASRGAHLCSFVERRTPPVRDVRLGLIQEEQERLDSEYEQRLEQFKKQGKRKSRGKGRELQEPIRVIADAPPLEPIQHAVDRAVRDLLDCVTAELRPLVDARVRDAVTSRLSGDAHASRLLVSPFWQQSPTTRSMQPIQCSYLVWHIELDGLGAESMFDLLALEALGSRGESFAQILIVDPAQEEREAALLHDGSRCHRADVYVNDPDAMATRSLQAEMANFLPHFQPTGAVQWEAAPHRSAQVAAAGVDDVDSDARLAGQPPVRLVPNRLGGKTICVMSDWGCLGPGGEPMVLKGPTPPSVFAVYLAPTDIVMMNHRFTGRFSLGRAYVTAIKHIKAPSIESFEVRVVSLLRGRDRTPQDDVQAFVDGAISAAFPEDSLPFADRSLPVAKMPLKRGERLCVEHIEASYSALEREVEAARVETLSFVRHTRDRVDYSSRRVFLLRWRRDFLTDHQNDDKHYESRFNVPRYARIREGDLLYNVPNRDSGGMLGKSSWAVVEALFHFNTFVDAYDKFGELLAPAQSTVNIEIVPAVTIVWAAEACDALRNTLCRLSGAAPHHVTVTVPHIVVKVFLTFVRVLDEHVTAAHALRIDVLCALLGIQRDVVSCQAVSNESVHRLVVSVVAPHLTYNAYRRSFWRALLPAARASLLQTTVFVSTQPGFYVSATVCRLSKAAAELLAHRARTASGDSMQLLGVSSVRVMASAVHPDATAVDDLFYSLYRDQYTPLAWRARFARHDPQRVVVWRIRRIVCDNGVVLPPKPTLVVGDQPAASQKATELTVVHEAATGTPAAEPGDATELPFSGVQAAACEAPSGREAQHRDVMAGDIDAAATADRCTPALVETHEVACDNPESELQQQPHSGTRMPVCHVFFIRSPLNSCRQHEVLLLSRMLDFCVLHGRTHEQEPLKYCAHRVVHEQIRVPTAWEQPLADALRWSPLQADRKTKAKAVDDFVWYVFLHSSIADVTPWLLDDSYHGFELAWRPVTQSLRGLAPALADWLMRFSINDLVGRDVAVSLGSDDSTSEDFAPESEIAIAQRRAVAVIGAAYAALLRRRRVRQQRLLARIAFHARSSSSLSLSITFAPQFRRASQLFYFTGHKVFVHTRIKNGKTFVPGGHQEPDDPDARHAAWREGREETGVTVPIESLHQSWEGSGTDGASWTLTDFVVRIHDSSSSLFSCAEASKHKDGRWLSIAELSRLAPSALHDENLVIRAQAAIQTARDLRLRPVTPAVNQWADRAARRLQRWAYGRFGVRKGPRPPSADFIAYRCRLLMKSHSALRLSVWNAWRTFVAEARLARLPLPPASDNEVRRAEAAYETEQLEARERAQRQRAKQEAKRQRASKQSTASPSNPMSEFTASADVASPDSTQYDRDEKPMLSAPPSRPAPPPSTSPQPPPSPSPSL